MTTNSDAPCSARADEDTASPSEGTALSRRDLLGLTTAAAFLTAGSNRPACPAQRTVVVGGKMFCANTDDPARHLANRLTFGATKDLVDEIDLLGIDGFIDQQLDPASIDDSALDAMLASYQTLNLNHTALLAFSGTPVIQDELQHAALLRAVMSRRQLYEVMVDFWTNHFNTVLSKTIYWKTPHEREVIRPLALGKFSDLLQAVATSPAMIRYLDLDHNAAVNPNQNFARELLELHTVSVDSGYSETDVTNASLVFTGWNYDAQGQFVFQSGAHHSGPLNVMGWSTQGTGGLADGLSLLDYLAHHPDTARHVVRKLCIRFVSDSPPESLITIGSQLYLANDTSIVPVLRYILETAHFWESARAKLRRPLEVVAAMLRALGASIDSDPAGATAATMRSWLTVMGQPLYAWAAPDGYPETASYWLTTDGMARRWDFARKLAAGELAGVGIDTLFLVPNPFFMTNEQWVEELQLRVLGATPHQSSLLAHMNALPPAALGSKIDELVALILASPDFQER